VRLYSLPFLCEVEEGLLVPLAPPRSCPSLTVERTCATLQMLRTLSLRTLRRPTASPPSSLPSQRLPLLSRSFRTLSPSLQLQATSSSAPPPPPPVTPTDTALHQAFDAPSSSYTSSPSSSTVVPTGLFGQPSLLHPSDFPTLATRTTLRAKVLVERLCRPTPPPQNLEQAEIAFLAMVKNLDRLSDLLCGVIDLAELVRNVHPEPEWVEGANEAYEQLCEYMNELNTHVGLYEVRCRSPFPSLQISGGL
jgi:hypothetical protein